MRQASFGLFALLVGCATTAPPVQQLTAASAAVGAAQEAGADRDAQANAYLTKARQELDTARAAMAAGDNEQAQGLLIRARADGALAVSLARESRLRAQAEQTSRRAEALRRNM
ncbi:MAG: uncharacterized protein JWN44_630 [Myxococcales bacterium]|nr:uncharacterized protein [Myxococcales bacterium]